MKCILFYCLIGLTTLACQQVDHVTPTDTCQLTQIVNEGGPNEFAYDQAGSLTKWVITIPVSNGTTDIVQYDFTRDATGRISSLNQTITNDGQIQSTATAQFIYTNGLLTSTTTTVDPTKPGNISRIFSYDPDGRISKRVVSDKTSGFTSTEMYAYDSRGNCTQYTYTDSNGVKSDIIATYDTSKNPEQLLIKSIPFNLLTGRPWSINAMLTTKETFDYGNGPETYTSQRTELKTDASSYVTSLTLAYDDGYVAKGTYALAGCK